MKNWKTTLFGALVAVSQFAPVLHNAGISIGHYGGSDWVQIAGGVSALLLGYHAQDKPKVN